MHLWLDYFWNCYWFVQKIIIVSNTEVWKLLPVGFNSEVGSGCHRVRSRVPPLLGESKAVVILTVLHGFNNSSSSFLGFSVLLRVACCPHAETKHWSELWFFVHHTVRLGIGTDLQCGIVKGRPYLKSMCSKTNYSFNMSKARIEQQIVN